MENEEIRNAVANCGAVITELQPFDSPYKGSFPVRNRLMSALTNATLVVEAPKISGTQRTVEHALNQGKDDIISELEDRKITYTITDEYVMMDTSVCLYFDDENKCVRISTIDEFIFS